MHLEHSCQKELVAVCVDRSFSSAGCTCWKLGLFWCAFFSKGSWAFFGVPFIKEVGLFLVCLFFFF